MIRGLGRSSGLAPRLRVSGVSIVVRGEGVDGGCGGGVMFWSASCAGWVMFPVGIAVSGTLGEACCWCDVICGD